MKSTKLKVLCSLLLTALCGLNASSQNVIPAETGLTRKGSEMTATLGLDFSDMTVKSNQAVVLVPMIINGNDTLVLDGVGIYGRTRWYQYERKDQRPVSGPNEIMLRYSKDMQPLVLSQTVTYSEWMNGSELVLQRNDYGCARCGTLEETMDDLAEYKEVEYRPVFMFGEAVAETVKTRELSGRAYVDFPVNQIVIYPDYRNNTYELGKIIATIDSVKNDKDITVTSLHIAGTASPEGPYENNVYLAKNRTSALKDYVQNLYNFPYGFITTSYEPVDWAGLKEFLQKGVEAKDERLLPHANEILKIVESALEPYQRNQKIKTTYPTEYQWLLTNVYPSLRHSDYRIEYTIRQFTDAAEIAEILKVSPQKLSLNEIYVLAGSLEPGSEDYNEVFETAVRLFPNDETANLNASVAAMQRGDYVSAEKYLAKGGGSPVAIYSWGVLNALKGNYVEALQRVEEAVSMGVEDNQGILENLREVAKQQKEIK